VSETTDSNASKSPEGALHPHVLIPPPILYIGSILIGLVIHWVTPIRVVPGGLATWIGVPAIAVGVFFLLWSFREFQTLNLHPGRVTSDLVTTGPFRSTRNPMYLFMSLIQAGIGFWVNTLWILLFLVGNVLFIHFYLIPLEERFMVEKFGEPYLDYKQRVRRWL
jgi:protein-S-isoprenylcysteine O-methyltransferase Ste14